MLAIIRTILIGYWRQGVGMQFLGIGVLGVLISLTAANISLGESSKIMTDVRMNIIEVIGIITVLFFMTSARHNARHNHNIHLILSHYNKKVSIYIAYYIAHIILIAMLYIFITMIAQGTIILFGNIPLDGFGSAIGLSYIKIIGLTSIARLIGSITSGYIASITTLLIYIIGHSTGFMMYYFQQQHNTTGIIMSKIIYYIVPNFQSLDHHPLLSGVTGSLDITYGIIIMIAYSIISITIGAHVVHHQEL